MEHTNAISNPGFPNCTWLYADSELRFQDITSVGGKMHEEKGLPMLSGRQIALNDVQGRATDTT